MLERADGATVILYLLPHFLALDLTEPCQTTDLIVDPFPYNAKRHVFEALANVEGHSAIAPLWCLSAPERARSTPGGMRLAHQVGPRVGVNPFSQVYDSLAKPGVEPGAPLRHEQPNYFSTTQPDRKM
jgi:hypothetical protein